MRMKYIAPIIQGIKKFILLDWIFVIILTAIAGYFLLNRSTKQEEFAYITIRLFNDEWRNPGTLPRSWYAQGLSVGQTAYDASGNDIAEIVSIGGYTVSDDERQIIDVGLKAKVTHNQKTQMYMLGYQTLMVGRVLDLTVNKFVIRGLVTYIDEKPIQYTDSLVEIKILSAFPWEIEKYKEGSGIVDLFGTIIGKIQSVAISDSTTYEIKDSYGQSFLVPAANGARKEVTMKISIKSYILNNTRYCINGTVLKTGNSLWLETADAAIKKALISNVQMLQ